MVRFNIPQKMKERSFWALWWLMFGGAGLWLLVGSVAYWVKHGWLPPDTAGWVQAVGSVLALAVAVSVPVWQRYRTEQDKSEALVLQRKVACLQTMHLVVELNQFLRETSGRSRYVALTGSIVDRVAQDHISRLNQIVEKSDDPMLLECCLEFRSVLNEMWEFGADKSSLKSFEVLNLRNRVSSVRRTLQTAIKRYTLV